MKKMDKNMTCGQSKPTSPLFIHICVLYIFSPAVFVVFFDVNIFKFLNVGTFISEIKNKNKNFMSIVPFDRRNSTMCINMYSTNTCK